MQAYTQQCEADHECGPNHFCYTETGLCATCTSCAIYQRLNSSSKLCPQSSYDCGDCMPGFAEELHTYDKTKMLCSAVEQVSVAGPTLWYIPVVALGLLLICGAIIWAYCKWKKGKGEVPSAPVDSGGKVTLDNDQGPRPFETSFPLLHNPIGWENKTPIQAICSAPPLCPHEYEGEVRLNMVRSKENLHSLQAVPFRAPGPQIDPDCLEENSYSEVDATLFVPIDEDTNPSSWTPGSAYGDVMEVGVMDSGVGPSLESSQQSSDSESSQPSEGPQEGTQGISLNFVIVSIESPINIMQPSCG